MTRRPMMTFLSFFFFNDTATTEIYTLSLHDALPIFSLGEYTTVGNLMGALVGGSLVIEGYIARLMYMSLYKMHERSEEHTSELQSQSNLVCRLLLEKKKGSHDVTVANSAVDLTCTDT